MSKQEDVLEQKLLGDKRFQHILKFAPESQRELMTFELAKYFGELYILKSDVEEAIKEAIKLTWESSGEGWNSEYTGVDYDVLDEITKSVLAKLKLNREAANDV